VQDARLWNQFWNQLAAHRLPDALVGCLAVEALDVDLGCGGLLVPYRIGDLSRGESFRGEPCAEGVAQVVQGDALDPRFLGGSVESPAALRLTRGGCAVWGRPAASWQAPRPPHNQGRGEMRRAIIPALLLVLVSVVLGATVFREQVAAAASNLNVFVTKEERVRSCICASHHRRV
jgi:hypothetical protein